MRLVDKLLPQRGQVTVGDRTFFTQGGSTDEAQLSNFRDYVVNAYRANGLVFALVGARKAILGEARFAFFDGSTYERDHPELAWLNESPRKVFQRLEQNGSLAGNAYIQRVQVGSGEWTARRLRPDWVNLLWSEDTDELVAVEYTSGGHGTKPELIAASDVAHWAPHEDPLHPVRGQSWLTPIARQILGDEAIERHKQNFFKHAATPNLAVSLKESVGTEKLTAISKLLSERHEGVDNAWKSIAVDNGADVSVVGVNFKDMAFKDLTESMETRMCGAAGTPPIIVGTTAGLQSSTYSNYGQAFRRWLDITIRTEWKGMTEAVASTVTPPAGSWLTYDDVRIPALQQDAKDEAEIHDLQARAIGSLIRAGFTPDSSIEAMVTKDLRLLDHTGLIPTTLGEGDTGLDPEDADPTDPTNA